MRSDYGMRENYEPRIVPEEAPGGVSSVTVVILFVLSIVVMVGLFVSYISYTEYRDNTNRKIDRSWKDHDARMEDIKKGRY